MSDVKNRLEFTLDVDGTSLNVLDFDLVEQLNEVSSLELRCTKYGDSGEHADPAALIDKPATFRFAREDGSQERFFHGFVIEAVRSPRNDRTLATHLTIVPTLWNATKRADCRIFQEKSVVDIVTEVLTGAGLDGSRHEWRVSGSYEPRVSCTQYRETDFEFIRRLLAEEGIWFSILMTNEKDLLALSDDPAGLDPISAPESTLGYLAEFSSQTAQSHVSDLIHTQQIRSDKAFLRDYDPTKPSVQLEKEVEGTDDGAHSLEVYEYPGRFTEQGVCDHYTQVLLEQLQADREIVDGSTGVIVMRPGETFSVEDHPYQPLNQEYLIVRVEFAGRGLGHAEVDGEEKTAFHGRFSAVPPARVQYRPPRRERMVVIPGLQSGWTTGPGGEEIHVDDSGQVKAHYHWDRLNPLDDTCSQWMRSSQLALGGSMLLPRMNWEVTIAHNEGDADKPVVMGRLYNPQTPPPYKLPDEKSKSSVQTATTPGGGSSNEFRMGDAGGAELMFFNASYDMTIDVLNNTTHSVGNDMKRKVGGNQAVNVTDSVSQKVGSNQTVDVGGNQDIAVETYMVDDVGASHSLDVGGNRTMMIGGDHKRDV
ncbi:MAG: type VI secretion system tip protein VgrG, partial [Myxococcales bacterium]|nr:type VI secretion system tip protein VgrG [Myxococcales bacterium]